MFRHRHRTTIGPPVNGGQRWQSTVAVNGGERRSTEADHRRTTGQRWSTVAVNSGSQRWRTTVNGGGPPSDHRRTTGQRWLTASQP
ncbi:hypothetical protein Tco_0483019, partial [Tanacetum coccineum]